MSDCKIPQKGAVARLRGLDKEKRSRKRPPEVIEEMKEIFNKNSTLALSTHNIDIVSR